MNLKDLRQVIKDNFLKRKKIDFDEENLHFEIEPLTSLDEVKVTEACKDLDGTQYIEAVKRHTIAYALKKINDIDFNLKDLDDGESIKSKFIVMIDLISEWPSSLIDILFDAYLEMNKELNLNIQAKVRFEKFKLSEEILEKETEKFRRLNEETSEGLTETERLDKAVKQEIETENIKMAETEHKALNE